MLSKTTGLERSRPRIWVTKPFSRFGDRDSLGRPFVAHVDRADLGGPLCSDEARKLFPRTARATGQNRLRSLPLRRRRGLVDDERLVQPPSIMRCGVSNAMTALSPASGPAEDARVEAERPVPLAPLVCAQLAEVHVARTDQRAGAVLEDQPARPPGAVPGAELVADSMDSG